MVNSEVLATLGYEVGDGGHCCRQTPAMAEDLCKYKKAVLSQR